MSDRSTAIIPEAAREQIAVWQDRQPITQAGLLQQALRLAERLPEKDFAINACNSRYGFMQVFLATLLRGQTMILPGDRSPGMLDKLRSKYPAVYGLEDDPASLEKIETHQVSLELPATDHAGPMPKVPLGREAVVVFTSGSTGTPLPLKKSPALLAATGDLIAKRFGWNGPAPAALLATVPSQHMYGLETSIAAPLWGGAAVHSAKPLYPADIAAALAALPAPRILVTTPIHLNALVKTKTALPALQQVISATAPLTDELAAATERLYDTEVCEIFGFSEAGTVATRRTLDGPIWHNCDSLVLQQSDDGCSFDAPHYPAPVPVNDIIEVLTPESFKLRGRPTDMVNIAGKRASLSGLNAILLAVPGVQDGAFFIEEKITGKVIRPIAFVVADGLTADQVLTALRKNIDSAFLPRQIYLVPQLPRSETGKLPRSALAALIAQVTSQKPG